MLLATHQFESVERAQLWAAREAQLALARREEQVYRDHASALQAASLDASRRYTEARDAAVRAQQQPAGDAEAFHRSFEAAQRVFSDSVQAILAEQQRAGEAAYAAYLASMADLRAETERLAHDAYRNYLRSIQAVWAHLDIDEIARELAGGWSGGAGGSARDPAR